MNVILFALIACLAINGLMFVPAFIYKTDKLTDISYAATFVVVATIVALVSQRTTPHLILLSLVLVWALRLGGFLFIRINKIKKDKRFDGVRENFLLFARFWFFQAITVFVVLLSGILFWQTKSSVISWVSIIGLIVFAVGLVLEAVADAQKYRFSQHDTSGRWINTGVWRISRHPNYLGEMMVWLGIYGFVAPSLSLVSQLVALLSPAYIIGLLLFVSGIPLLEKAAELKWGKLPEYQKYKREVPVLVPSISSLGGKARNSS